MTNSTHTPGPWISNIGEDKLRLAGSIYSVPENDDEPGLVLDFSRMCFEDEEFYALRGDLALIAAAPDLLASLELILDGGIAEPEVVAAAHAAIRKAKGQYQ